MDLTKGRSPSPSVIAGVAESLTNFRRPELMKEYGVRSCLEFLSPRTTRLQQAQYSTSSRRTPLYIVVGVADDAPSAFALASAENPHVALLDLELARGSTGFAAAAQFKELGVICLFVSGKAPDIVMADLAIGCLANPFTGDELHLALSIADDVLRGRSTGRSRFPPNLTLYDARSLPDRLCRPGEPVPLIQQSRYSIKRRTFYWLMALGSN